MVYLYVVLPGIESTGKRGTLSMSPREESNLDQRLRSPQFYPLNYRGYIFYCVGAGVGGTPNISLRGIVSFFCRRFVSRLRRNRSDDSSSPRFKIKDFDAVSFETYKGAWTNRQNSQASTNRIIRRIAPNTISAPFQ